MNDDKAGESEVDPYVVSPETLGSERLRETVIRTFEQLHQQARSGRRIRGLCTGFIQLDTITSGLHPGTMTVIGARPGMGKTALATNIAVNACHSRLNSKETASAVLYFSLGMSKALLVLRMLAAEARVELERVVSGNLERSNWESLAQAAGMLSDLPFVIDDTPRLTVEDIRERVQRMHEEHGLALVVIDCLQFITPALRGDTREREMSTISRELKMLVREMQHIPFVALSTLNRGVEARGLRDRRPLLADLRSSGSLEDDADVVLLLYRDEVHNPETIDQGIAELHIAKQGLGPMGRVKFRFSGQSVRFDELVEDDDVEAPLEPDWNPEPLPSKPRRPARRKKNSEEPSPPTTTATD